MEKTLSIIKPDGVEKGIIGEVIKRFEGNGLRIKAMKMISLSLKRLKGFIMFIRRGHFLRAL